MSKENGFQAGERCENLPVKVWMAIVDRVCQDRFGTKCTVPRGVGWDNAKWFSLSLSFLGSGRLVAVLGRGFQSSG
jgi:hypothetical protein